MTSYTPEELNGDWEFKIVRAYTPVFRKPGVLKKLVEEEAGAGWVMLEMFDNSRVRFKRRRRHSSLPHSLRTDHRTNTAFCHHFSDTKCRIILVILIIVAIQRA
jgi:hypothetical protein